MGELERGREFYASRAWKDAFESLSAADSAGSLVAEDLELMARSAYMLGRDDAYVAALERAYQAHLDAGEAPAAARCAFWIWLNLMPQGEEARAAGWLGRAQRQLEREPRDCVERGYLLIPALLGSVASGDSDAAYATASAAAAIADRFDDADLMALVVMEQGHALVRQGQVDEGLRLVDEVMVAVTTRDLSPVVTGIVYCNTIAFCAGEYELGRAREWTAAMQRWCDEQPDMLAHAGVCLVHRAELMELQGEWRDALDEARRAGECVTHGVLNSVVAGHALYRQGEIHRLRGHVDAAELAYQEASRKGWEPQPGLALLRLAEGKGSAASAAIRRAIGETSAPLERVGLLPAFVEIMLAVGDVEAARDACRALAETATDHWSDVLRARSAYAQGAVALADGDARAALDFVRHAWDVWKKVDAPYESALARVLVGLACRALGDEDTALLDLEVARSAFSELGAAPDVTRVEALIRRSLPVDHRGLTGRELQVLRLLAAGATNRAIAAELVLSERTVDRHASNIYTKLGVSTRAAATAFAYEHDLV